MNIEEINKAVAELREDVKPYRGYTHAIGRDLYTPATNIAQAFELVESTPHQWNLDVFMDHTCALIVHSGTRAPLGYATGETLPVAICSAWLKAKNGGSI